MSIKVVCPTCGQTLHVSERFAGKEVACPSCRQAVRIFTQTGRVAESPVLASPSSPSAMPVQDDDVLAMLGTPRMAEPSGKRLTAPPPPSIEASTWSVAAGGEFIGPMSYEKLKQLARDGAIWEYTSVSANGNDWIPARDIPGLFRASTEETPIPSEPTVANSQAYSDFNDPRYQSSDSSALAYRNAPRPIQFAPARQPDFSCPNCRSGETQKVSVIYESGTIVGQYKSESVSGAIIDPGNANVVVPVVGTSTTEVRQRTALASKMAPPQPFDTPAPVYVHPVVHVGPVATLVIMVGFFLIVVGSVTQHTVGVCFLVTGIVVLSVAIPRQLMIMNKPSYEEVKAAEEQHKDELAAWQQEKAWSERRLYEWHHSNFCHRCGTVFLVEGL